MFDMRVTSIHSPLGALKQPQSPLGLHIKTLAATPSLSRSKPMSWCLRVNNHNDSPQREPSALDFLSGATGGVSVRLGLGSGVATGVAADELP